MPFGLGVWELLLIFAVLLLVFGAKRLPELGGALGRGIREFKTSIRDIDGELKRPADAPQRELRPPVQGSQPSPPSPGDVRSDPVSREEPRQS